MYLCTSVCRDIDLYMHVDPSACVYAYICYTDLHSLDLRICMYACMYIDYYYVCVCSQWWHADQMFPIALT